MERTLLEKYNDLSLDIVPTHPDWTEEDYDKYIAELKEEEKDWTEWPDI